jgi:hypothetical protein
MHNHRRDHRARDHGRRHKHTHGMRREGNKKVQLVEGVSAGGCTFSVAQQNQYRDFAAWLAAKPLSYWFIGSLSLLL